ncbi:hypothetical protein ACFV4K_32385, partial [Nocardia sp. NPDC059764]|uniref:hypothetical protein n=1 Tax=Nocardia sp. NPDC059764 TaxID=3346939 RepID=UPI003667DDD9
MTTTGIPLRQTVRATLRQTTRATLGQTARVRITLRQTTGSGIPLGQATITRGETVPRTQTLLVRILCGKTIGPVALRRGTPLRETTRRSRTTLRRSAIGTGLTGRQTTRGRITRRQTTSSGVTRRETTGSGVTLRQTTGSRLTLRQTTGSRLTLRQTTGGRLTTGRTRIRSTRRGSTVRTRLRSATPRLLRHSARSGTLRLTQPGLTAGGAIGARLTGRQTARPGRSRARRGFRSASPRLRRRKSHRGIA